MSEKIGAALVDRRRIRELRRCQTDLYYLCCKLGYAWSPAAQQGVTDHLHKPIAADLDARRHESRVARFFPRKTCKTTLMIARAVQEILRNPDICMLTLHMAEDEAVGIVQEVGDLLVENEYLRSLDPIGQYPEGHDKAGQWYSICPKGNWKKKFVTAKGFTVMGRPKMNPTTRRQPTMCGKGLTSTLTGRHVDLIFYDDIIGHETMQDSTGMAKARDVMKYTVTNVLNAQGRILCVGTRWDDHDVYATEMLKPGSAWDVLVRHAIEEEDGSMGEITPRGKIVRGDVIHYGPTVSGGDGKKEARHREKLELNEMGPSVYAGQRMNDPSPSGLKPWKSDQCEHWIPKSEALRPGFTIVLSDPAPAEHGSMDQRGEKRRGDGTKNFWANAVIRWQAIGQTDRMVLLDGEASQEWDTNEGLASVATLMRRYGTYHTGFESYGGLQKSFEPDMKAMAVQSGVGAIKFLKLAGNASGQKNTRIKLLADYAKQGRFVISDGCDPQFAQEFLENMRGFRPLPSGENTLKFDDWADVVARGTDPAVRDLAPLVDMPEADHWIEQEEYEDYIADVHTRYMGV